MAKPSIFNGDYNRRVKRRKKNIIIAVILCIIVIILLVFSSSFKSNFNISKLSLAKVFNFTSTKKSGTDNLKKPDKANTITPKTNTANIKKEESYAITLSNGKQIKAVYDIKDNVKTFKSILPKESAVNYTISPSGKNIIIFDDKIQSMIYMDSEGNKHDITNAAYVSTSGTTFEKDKVLSQRPDYIWCSTPKFIDDDNIAYLSQLPWFNKTTKFVWVENLKTKVNSRIDNLSGENIKFEDAQSKGLPVVLDGVTKFLSPSGSVAN